MATSSSPILNPEIDLNCELPQQSRICISTLSLKRKHHANNVASFKENFGEKPFRKRLLSLKKNRCVPKKGVDEIPATLDDTENGSATSLLATNANLVKEVSLRPTFTYVNKNVNEFVNDTDFENEGTKSNNPAFTCFNTNINEFFNKTHVENVGMNLNNSEFTCVKSNINEVANGALKYENIETNLKDVCEAVNSKSIIYPTPYASFNEGNKQTLGSTSSKSCIKEQSDDCIIVNDGQSLISVSSATEIGYTDDTLNTILYYDKPFFSLSFALTDCKNVNVSTKNSSIKRISVSHVENDTNIDCEVIENSHEPDIDKLTPSPSKKQAASVNLEIKKNNLPTSEDQSKVLILKTNAIEKLSHVIVQPSGYKSFRRKIQRPSKISSGNKRKPVLRSARKDGKASVDGVKLKQTRLDTFLRNRKDSNGIRPVNKEKGNSGLRDDAQNCKNEVLRHDDMSKTVRTDTARSDGTGRLSRRVSKEDELSRSPKMPYRDPMSRIRTCTSETPQLRSPRCKTETASSCSPRRNSDSLHFNLPCKTKANKPTVVLSDIPHYKIVAGTHFAVDAFCYGDIPGVKNYFLTHFHSDHYSGLKKNFNKTLFCTQITADLCTSRLGVHLKHIHIITIDETVIVDGVEVTAIDANHCPGAVMLLFTLPNGKTLLHTGDFRAIPAMESHPAFWNSDIHTIYLDTTYCNPRYDFPTQDQSLEMALQILRQKKLALEKVGKKFASVLIVCGTYTIGKEKFFLGLARRVGCAVWACPEKDKVLQTVEKRTFSHASPQSCQLHVVPMRDLTHEKLRSYLDSLKGPFSEVVAFKPSGWENGKNTPAFKDAVTIHGIPYSEHSSFSEMIRFVNFLKPKQVVPTVDISGGVKAVQKYFPCPLVYKEDVHYQSKLTDFFNTQNRQQIPAVS